MIDPSLRNDPGSLFSDNLRIEGLIAARMHEYEASLRLDKANLPQANAEPSDKVDAAKDVNHQ